ncbi:MAG: serine--tRNA ligase [Rhodospirillales bacterium]|jgi:seryl-tRNA synthetase|nr:serine--tRNA ligase [Rhodospirillales bacterium]MDP6882844.1 serine--tRNA ligase [Rhodospirillales bacterium]
MFDIKWIRENPDAFDDGLGRRSLEPAAAELMALDGTRREAQTAAQEIQAGRNALSKEIGAAKAKGEDAAALIAEVSHSKKEQGEAEERARAAAEDLDRVLSGLPNLPADDVPVGPDEAANVEVRRWGEAPQFDFEAKEHFDIGEGLGLMDFEGAARMSGARFVILTGALARMERALANFMLDLHTNEFGHTEVNPPALVRDAALYGTGQLPKFGADLFETSRTDYDTLFEQARNTVHQLRLKNTGDLSYKDFDDLEKAFVSGDIADRRLRDRMWLIPTAEVPLTNMVAGAIVDEAALPLRYAAMTWCFRSEAGAAGKDTRGMIRQHQFTKVEMVAVTRPEDSGAELERMTGCAEEVLKRLGLPFRTVVLSTGDMGFSARKTYDVEVWLPGQGRFREISSCSDCGDFQARRMKARYRPAQGKGTRFVHTLNGSGLAVGRTLVAILENFQRADGSVAVPEGLRPYMGGLDVIEPHES